MNNNKENYVGILDTNDLDSVKESEIALCKKVYGKNWEQEFDKLHKKAEEITKNTENVLNYIHCRTLKE
ncbi:MAG: hypothetical protein IJ583_01565 [Firmicutes bacterium]|nr:hypothetical protein [Bacillota bacterium]